MNWGFDLNKFESVVEAGGDGLNLFFSCQVGLFLGDRLYSCTQGDHAHAICEVPVLDIIVMDSNHIEFFWSISEAFGNDLVFAYFILAFTSFKDIAGLNRVENDEDYNVIKALFSTLNLKCNSR